MAIYCKSCYYSFYDFRFTLFFSTSSFWPVFDQCFLFFSTFSPLTEGSLSAFSHTVTGLCTPINADWTTHSRLTHCENIGKHKKTTNRWCSLWKNWKTHNQHHHTTSCIGCSLSSAQYLLYHTIWESKFYLSVAIQQSHQKVSCFSFYLRFTSQSNQRNNLG